MVTCAPIVRAHAATSQPIQPAPTTTTRLARAMRYRRSSESATVRSDTTPGRSTPGMSNDLGAAPVARIKARGIPVLCWTIKSPEAAARALKIADAITFESFRPPIHGA